MNVSERCSCGAALTIDAPITKSEESYKKIEEWRTKHHHQVRIPGYGGTFNVNNLAGMSPPERTTT